MRWFLFPLRNWFGAADKPMMTAILPVILCLTPSSLIQAAVSQPAPAYTQTYRIFLKGEPAGFETVEETTDKDGNVLSNSEHEIFVTDGMEIKRMAFVTRMILAKGTLALLHYSYRYTSGQSKDSFEVTAKSGKLEGTITRGGRSVQTTHTITPDMILLDFNVYHQYDYLSRHYDFKKAGRQAYRNYIPLIGNEISMTLTLLNESNLDTPKGPLGVRNFRIGFGAIRAGSFSIDRAGRLVRLEIREQELQVVREDLLPKQP
jgi:hypothetical protein